MNESGVDVVVDDRSYKQIVGVGEPNCEAGGDDGAFSHKVHMHNAQGQLPHRSHVGVNEMKGSDRMYLFHARFSITMSAI